MKSKSNIKETLQVQMSLPIQPKPDAVIIVIQPCAQLWAISQSTSSSVKDLGDSLFVLSN